MLANPNASYLTIGNANIALRELCYCYKIIFLKNNSCLSYTKYDTGKLSQEWFNTFLPATVENMSVTVIPSKYCLDSSNFVAVSLAELNRTFRAHCVGPWGLFSAAFTAQRRKSLL